MNKLQEAAWRMLDQPWYWSVFSTVMSANLPTNVGFEMENKNTLALKKNPRIYGFNLAGVLGRARTLRSLLIFLSNFKITEASSGSNQKVYISVFLFHQVCTPCIYAIVHRMLFLSVVYIQIWSAIDSLTRQISARCCFVAQFSN